MVRRSKKYKWDDRAEHKLYMDCVRSEAENMKRSRQMWEEHLINFANTDSIFMDLNKKSVICSGEVHLSE